MNLPPAGTVRFHYGIHNLRIDFDSASVYVDDQDVILTPTQYRILAFLAGHAGSVVSARDIIDAVWGEWYGPVDHVFVYIHHIRNRLGPCGRLIRTRRTLGYVLQGDPSPDGRRDDPGASHHGSSCRLRLGPDLELLSVETDGHALGGRLSEFVGGMLEVDGLDWEAVRQIVDSIEDCRGRLFTGTTSIGPADRIRIPVQLEISISFTAEAAAEVTIDVWFMGERGAADHVPLSTVGDLAE